MAELDLDSALALFKLPRDLGVSPEGEEIAVSIGRYGPYVRYDDKFVSIKDEDPYTIGLERALELVAEKKQADAERVIKIFEEQGIQILRGRFGPYITNGQKNARVPKDTDPTTLTLAECEALIAAAPERRARGKKATRKKAAKKATKKAGSTEKKTAKKAAAKKTTKKKKTTPSAVPSA